MTVMRKSITSLFLMMVLLVTACQKEEANPTPNVTPATLAELLRTGGLPDEPEVRDNTTSTTSEVEEEGTLFSCTTTEVDAAIAPQEFNNYDPNADVILAGNLLEGNSLQKGTPNRIPLRRGGGTLTISTLNGSEQVSKSIDEFTGGNYFEALNDLLIENSGIVPARFNFTIEQIQAVEELELKLQAEASFLGRISTSLSFSTDIEKKFNRFLVMLNQSYFSVLFDRPNSLEEFFHPNVTLNDIDAFVDPGNPMTYISSVNIGRQFALLIESTESAAVIEASANACFSGNCGGGETKVLNELKDLRVKAFALGGEANQLIQAVTSDVSELQTFLASSGDIRTGLPLSYVVRTVLEDRIVRNAVATKFTIENCVPVAPKLCDCQFTGDDCDIPTEIRLKNKREVQIGSGNSDSSAGSTRTNEAIVGFKIGLKKGSGVITPNTNVDIFQVITKRVNPDGTLSNKRVINGSNSNGSATIELQFEAPGNALITGIGLRASDHDANRAQIFFREIFLDENDCRIKYGPEQSVRLGSDGGLEREYKLDQDYDMTTKTPILQHITFGAHNSNFHLLKFKVGELHLE